MTATGIPALRDGEDVNSGAQVPGTRLPPERPAGQRGCQELSRRVEDLRAFEGEYRSRLLAYLESQAEKLRSGTDG